MVQQLNEGTWRARRLAHHGRVDLWTKPYLDRRSRGQAHPVEDFLFTYYSHSPAALRRWSPGVGVELLGDVRDLDVAGYRIDAGTARVGPRLTPRARKRLTWVRDLLAATSRRQAQLGCFGLHEWAMVYRQPQTELRHDQYPLRLGTAATEEVVESHRIKCTHFDAFRFFTSAAGPLNVIQPARDNQLSLDQPGCLHAGMDLYRWAYSMSPLIASELVADCFGLASDIRVLDMRASPYDLSPLGYEPVRIETAAGKQEYVTAQREFAARAAPLRARLLSVYERVLAEASTQVASA